MKVSGFSFVRNAVRLRYPVVAALRSILPLCDQLVVNVGLSDDGTLDLVRSIGDPRLTIFESRWDEAQLAHGRVLAEQTDLALERCQGDVCLYVQADEVVHEDDHPRIRAGLERVAGEPGVEGLLFDYVHFYGSLHTTGVSRKWYRREVRAVKNGIGVCSWRDAQGFRVWDPPAGFAGPRPRMLQPGHPARKLRVVSSGAHVFHYGWARPPAAQTQKVAEMERLYHGDEARRRRLAQGFAYDPGEKVRPFAGTHPEPMRAFVAENDWPFEARPKLLRTNSLDNLREDLLDLFEAGTGIRLGEYRNYRLVG